MTMTTIQSTLPLLTTLLLLFLLQQSHSYAFTSIKSQLSSGLIGRIREITQNGNENGCGPSTRTPSSITAPGKKDLSQVQVGKRDTITNLYMRDMSSANVFQIGDRVKVVSSVFKAGVDLNGRIGTVQETWEKCEVDPTCCCAEFVDENFAVTVKFDGSLSLGINPSDTNKNISIFGLNDHFTHFFSEDELVHVKSESITADNKEDCEIEGEQNKDTGKDVQTHVAFDGMSCTAFKLDQLKMGEQAKRIAAYEASLDTSEKGGVIDSN